jgi:hypothetical protein
MIFPVITFSQSNLDTTLICVPYKAAKQMAIELNRLDSLTAVNKLTVIELSETQKKVQVYKDIVSTMELKEKNYELQISKEKEKFGIIERQNDDLRKEVKKLKVKNTIISIVSGAVITALTTLSILN